KMQSYLALTFEVASEILNLNNGEGIALMSDMQKLQPMPGPKFWKIVPEEAMEPPPFVKLVGRPTVKRKIDKDEALKAKRGKESRLMKKMKSQALPDFPNDATVEDLHLTAPQPSQDSAPSDPDFEVEEDIP
ncbi:hypothetical protein HAX54_004313, partial [Datura stramonium]|nr:hypothetical protein [Datura stramonium]